MRVVADLGLCQGHQMCTGEAPDVFAFDDDTDQVVVTQEHPDEVPAPAGGVGREVLPGDGAEHRGGSMSSTPSLTRAEIDEFWESWLAINREAERTGDWRVMAEWYAEDATYGWMLTPDEHFMAVGRDQIRDWAIGIEMDGFDGWHYDYQATVVDEKNAMIVGFWKQRSGIVDDATGREFEVPGSGRELVRGGAAGGRRAQVLLAARLVRLRGDGAHHGRGPEVRQGAGHAARPPEGLRPRGARSLPPGGPAVDGVAAPGGAAASSSPRSRREHPGPAAC